MREVVIKKMNQYDERSILFRLSKVEILRVQILHYYKHKKIFVDYRRSRSYIITLLSDFVTLLPHFCHTLVILLSHYVTICHTLSHFIILCPLLSNFCLILSHFCHIFAEFATSQCSWVKRPFCVPYLAIILL